MRRLGIEPLSVPPFRVMSLCWSELESPLASWTISEVVPAAGVWVDWVDDGVAAAWATVGVVKIVDVMREMRTKSDPTRGRRLRACSVGARVAAGS
jgi:hypothetical protein